MWNPETNGVHETHDVILMKRMFYEEKDMGSEVSPMEIDKVDNDEVEEEEQNARMRDFGCDFSRVG